MAASREGCGCMRDRGAGLALYGACVWAHASRGFCEWKFSHVGVCSSSQVYWETKLRTTRSSLSLTNTHTHTKLNVLALLHVHFKCHIVGCWQQCVHTCLSRPVSVSRDARCVQSRQTLKMSNLSLKSREFSLPDYRTNAHRQASSFPEWKLQSDSLSFCFPKCFSYHANICILHSLLPSGLCLLLHSYFHPSTSRHRAQTCTQSDSNNIAESKSLIKSQHNYWGKKNKRPFS